VSGERGVVGSGALGHAECERGAVVMMIIQNARGPKVMGSKRRE